MNPNSINILVLAYLGDTIYENYVRRHLIKEGIANVNDLQTESLKFVSAKSQAAIVTELINNKLLTDEEISIIKRARNSKNNHHPKSCDIITYKYATGLEAMIGYLDFLGSTDRIEEIMNLILGEIK